MTHFAEYLARTGTRQADFAERIGTTQGTVSRLASGAMPSLDLAIKIERETHGAVPASSWIAQSTTGDAA